jgi:hypothetical protein
VSRLDDLPVKLRIEQRSALSGQVIANHDHVHHIADLGQLLNGIHDDEVVANAQVVNQGLLREFVDARLVAAEVDGNPVRLLVVQGLHYAFS